MKASIQELHKNQNTRSPESQLLQKNVKSKFTYYFTQLRKF